MSKKIKNVAHELKLLVEAGSMKPTPSIAAALAPKKVKPAEFLKVMAEKTKHLEAGAPVPVIVFIDQKGAFDVDVKSPMASYLLKKAAKITKGVEQAKKMPDVGVITKAQLLEIAKIKIKDLSTSNIDQAAKILAGTAISMGITVKG